MLQLRRIRSYTKDGKPTEYDTCFEPDILVDTHSELFSNLDSYIQKIPEFERYNCHYTLGESSGGKRRGKGNFTSQSLVPFDVDGIEFSSDKEENKKAIDTFCKVFFDVTKLSREKTVTVFSGGGLHFLVLTAKWEDRDYFKKNSKAYAAVCTELEKEFRLAGLKFKELDRMVFTPNHMLRLPGTVNRKTGRPDRMARILEGNLQQQTVDWQAFAKLSVKTEKPASSDDKKYSPPDSTAVEEGCEFLKACKDNPAMINEASWYASLTILARLDNGKEKCHDYSRGHPNYSQEECDTKIESALQNTGPRTCENIATLGPWCGDCKFNGKVKSPIAIKSEEFIATEFTGFTAWKGKEADKPVPQPEDLAKFFDRENPYKTNKQSAEVYVFDGKKYVYHSKNQLRGFAGKHFSPQPNEVHVVEFINRVNRRNHVDPSFFDPMEPLINFNNGILDLRTGKLMEHSPEYGFLHVLPYDYDPDAKCPEFDAMMARVMCGDTELEQLLLEFTGYALCDRTYKHHKALILIGEGANGKSTFLDVVKALAGEKNFSALGIKEMNKDTNLFLLEGKLVNISDEMPNMAMQDTDFFKKMMGGSITIRRLYGMPTVHRCMTKLMFAANEIPATYDHSHGMFRRLIIVPFEARFEEGKVDHGLMDRMLKELPGIFNRVLKAAGSLSKRGYFAKAERSAEQLNAYKTENDAMGAAIEDHLVARPGPWTEDDFISTQDLFIACCPDAKYERDKTKRKFQKALQRKYADLKIREARKWVGTDGQKKYLRGYLGIIVATEKTVYKNGNGKAHSVFDVDFSILDLDSAHPAP